MYCAVALWYAQIPQSNNNVDEASVPLFSISVVASSRELARLYQMLALGGSLNGMNILVCIGSSFVFNYHKFLSLKGTKLFEREFIEKYLLEQICDINYSPLVKTSRAGFIFIINPVCDTMQYCSSWLFSYEII